MKSNLLSCAILLFPVLFSSCNSSKSTDSGDDTVPDLTNIDEYKGIANGTVTIGGKSFPIEFTADAYAKYVTLTGFTDLARQDTGWQVIVHGKTSTTSAQDIMVGYLLRPTLFYRPIPDSVQCVYSPRAGTITIESFVAKKSGEKNYFITSGKASFTSTRSNVGTYSPIACPDISVEVAFSNIYVFDSGLNL
jgi:hypothetical protein